MQLSNRDLIPTFDIKTKHTDQTITDKSKHACGTFKVYTQEGTIFANQTPATRYFEETEYFTQKDLSPGVAAGTSPQHFWTINENQ